MRHRPLTDFLATGMLIVLAACGGDSADSSRAGPSAEELPGTDGTEVRSYLNGQDYRTQWSLWPGKGERYEGTEPHGMLLTTYVNDVALDALQSGTNTVPAGAVIVKENYMPDGTLAAITTMYKVSGFDADNRDWFWLKNDPDGVIEVEGRVAGCIGCHTGAADFDYLWTLQQERQ